MDYAASHDAAWNVLKATVVRTADYAKAQRQKHAGNKDREEYEAFLNKVILSLSPDCRVLHGPFQGMKYPLLKTAGGALVPKLLGSYEKEIQPIIERICGNDYTEIVDVGCAEGYYAVGLAMRIQKARVFAYDTNQEAISLCMQMAQANDVADRVIPGRQCTPDTLRALPFTGRALIFSDCEGYEKTLFAEDLIPCLADHDVLVEIHDFIDIEISTLLRQRFQASHDITVIASIDDIAKARIYDFPELENCSLAERRRLLTERRGHIMEWFFMTPRAS